MKDPSAAYDVTTSMSRILESKAAVQGMDYRAKNYTVTECDALPHLGGGPLKRAVVVQTKDGYAAVLPDGRKEDVTVDATNILNERLEFVRNNLPEMPEYGKVLPKMSCRFVISAPGKGVELQQGKMTSEDQLASISNPDVRIKLARANELPDLGDALLNGIEVIVSRPPEGPADGGLDF